MSITAPVSGTSPSDFLTSFEQLRHLPDAGLAFRNVPQTLRFGPLRLEYTVDVQVPAVGAEAWLSVPVLGDVSIGHVRLDPKNTDAQLGGSYAGVTARVDLKLDLAASCLYYELALEVPGIPAVHQQGILFSWRSGAMGGEMRYSYQLTAPAGNVARDGNIPITPSGSWVKMARYNWQFWYPWPPFYKRFDNENGLQIHFSPQDAGNMGAVLGGAATAIGAMTGIGAVLSALAGIAGSLVGHLVFNPDGSLDLRLSANGIQIGNAPAADPNVWLGPLWPPIAAQLHALAGGRGAVAQPAIAPNAMGTMGRTNLEPMNAKSRGLREDLPL